MNYFWQGFYSVFEFYFGWLGVPKRNDFSYTGRFQLGGLSACFLLVTVPVVIVLIFI